MWHRLNSYKTTLQCHDESHSSSSSSHVQLELYHASGKLREKSSVLRSLKLSLYTIILPLFELIQLHPEKWL